MAEAPRNPQSFVLPQVLPALEDQQLSFSFKYLAVDHPRFGLHACSADYLSALLRQINIFSSRTVDWFMDQNNHEHRHMVVFSETTEPGGFSLDEQLETELVWQFAVTEQSFWRVHGFMLDDTFYVVWLDPSHLLYLRPGAV